MDISYRVFVNHLLKWSAGHPRPMPWKRTKDPYKIWLSEIMLQQTQVRQGIPYYMKFIRRFPTVRHLAKASEDEVLHLWQGLGYNSRARHLHTAAREIVENHNAVFPGTYESIRKLKGVGDYTAAAVASFAFGLPNPVIDSNVVRVLSRIFDVAGDPARQQTRTVFLNILNEMIRRTDPAQFNQALMNFGATQCRPINPDCSHCIFNSSCVAFNKGIVEKLPQRKPKRPRRQRFFHYFIIRHRRALLIHQRHQADIWRQMFELPLLETKSPRKPSHAAWTKYLHGLGVVPERDLQRIHADSQVLTHQVVSCHFYEVRVMDAEMDCLPYGYRYEMINDLRNFAWPKVFRTFHSGRFHTFNDTQKLDKS